TINNDTFSTDKMALFNMSTRRTRNGHYGLIRGSIWNSHNVEPPFSYPYIIELDLDGSMKSFTRVDLDYNDFMHCNLNHNGVYANGLEDPRIFTYNNENWVICN